MPEEMRPAPCRVAYFIARSMARFFGSIFFPFFRYWGETDFKNTKKRIFIARNRGLLSWLTALRVFKHPIRFVMADKNDTSIWFKIALSGALAPIRLSFDYEADLQTLAALGQHENCMLLVTPAVNSYTESLVAGLKYQKSIEVLFMAVSGPQIALAAKTLIPKVCQISVFCAMPIIPDVSRSDTFAELEFLERATENIPLGELPSIFTNHKRNIKA